MSNFFENDDFDELDAMIEALLKQAGISPRMMPGGFRIVISGSMPNGTHAPADSAEPAAEVHTIGDEVMVVAEVPGARLEDIRLGLSGDTLTIDTGTENRAFRTRVDLPPVDPGSMQSSCKNGVLEVTFRKAAAPSAG